MINGIEEDKGLSEFFKKWKDIEYSPLGICEECKIHGPVHRYKNRETQEIHTFCMSCVWYYVSLTAEYLKMEEAL